MPDGYAIVRVDFRGAGCSPGYLEVWSPREAKDLYHCVEWAGTQAWSSGKVGINGISYYAMNQWHVAPLRPPHLAALCIWEGSADYYRELARHGGILCDFLRDWSRRQVTNVQYGVGERGPRSKVTGAPVAGAETLPEEELARNRADVGVDALRHRFIDDYYRARAPAFDKIDVPMLSAANWGGHGLHTRGNFEGYLAAPIAAEMARSARRYAFLAFLQRVWLRFAEALLRSFPQGRGHRLGAPTQGGAQYPPARRAVHPAGGERVAARAHPVDQISSRSRQPRPGRAAPARLQPLSLTIPAAMA